MPLIAWKALDWIKSIPWQVWVIALLLILYPVAYCVGHSRGESDERARWEASIAKANETALKDAGVAAGKAREIAKDVTDKVEAENERARDAASGSDDPLKSALDSLR